jgi:transforming growth factor-beta-induced protein
VKTALPLSLAIALAAGATAPSVLRAEGDGRPPQPAPKDIVDTAASAGAFSTLLAAAKAAGLVETLKGPGPLTVFAPTDEAFRKLPPGTVEGLLKDPAALRDVLTYHVVSGRVPASAVASAPFLETVQGQSVRVRVEGPIVRIDEARVLTPDVPASNGVIHVIDTVLLPRRDIVATAVAAGTFKTLVSCVEAAGLADALKGKGPFTVFAPSDAAFAKIPAETLAALAKDGAKLASILTYHVVPGRVLSTDLPQGRSEAKTLDGRLLEVVRSADGSVTVGGARVVTADVLAGNGVIHVIDTVVLPK